MRIPNGLLSRALVSLVLPLAFAAPRLLADSITYTYTGQPFVYIEGALLTTDDFVGGTFTFASPLPDAMALTNVTSLLTSWQLTNGVVTADPSDFTMTLFLATDSQGAISQWSVNAGNHTPNLNPGTFIGAYSSKQIDTYDFSTIAVDDAVCCRAHFVADASSVAIGSWAESTQTASPEATTSVLTFGGLGALLAFSRTRHHRLP